MRVMVGGEASLVRRVMTSPAAPTAGLCELTLETRELCRMEAFYTRCSGSRCSLARRTG
jgi:hypothetical protein